LNPQPLNGDVSSLPNEPLIRVGIFATTDDKMVVRAKFGPIEVRSGSTVVCQLPTNGSVMVSYDRSSSLYRIGGDCPAAQSSTYYVVRAQDGLSPMEMTDFSRPVAWLPGANDNTFRTQLELRWSSAVSQAWVINELPIEWYLKGIAETSNVSPMQYQRALLTAARTYAMYHVQRQTKHASKYFTVDASLDQVYRGYGAEARSPTIVAAVEATRGQIVTYQGKLALTPYFSRSDGRTRSWGEVWYGQSNYPWLVSVPVPDDVGKTLWGHGVGMSATGALQMDAKWGKTYDQILSHFYAGTELRRIYK
jgi:peptidoglycan hydrolase-like amidase